MTEETMNWWKHVNYIHISVNIVNTYVHVKYQHGVGLPVRVVGTWLVGIPNKIVLVILS